MSRLLCASFLLVALALPMAAGADTVVVMGDRDRGGRYGREDYFATPFAHPGSFGLGIGATSLVTGLTAKLYLGYFVALQATVGWWYAEGPVVNMDLIFELPRLAGGRNVSLNWNLGFGGTVGFETYNHSTTATLGGINGVAGLALQFRPIPFEFIVELRPTYIIGGDNGWGGIYLGAGGSIRIFFG